MRAVLSFGQLKEAALYFDRVLPIVFTRIQGTGDDTHFWCPDFIPSRALMSLMAGVHRTAPDSTSRWKVLGPAMNAWQECEIQVRRYVDPRESAGDYCGALARAYLSNKMVDGHPPIRDHFRRFAFAIGVSTSDVLLPRTPFQETEIDCQDPVVSLTGIPLIDTTQASWDQILEVRCDEQAQRKLRRLRSFLSTNYEGKPLSFIEDDLSVRVEDYEQTRRKHGFDTAIGVFSVLLDSKALAGATIASLGGLTVGGIATAITAGTLFEVGKIAVEIAKRRRILQEWQSTHELAYIIELVKQPRHPCAVTTQEMRNQDD